MRKLTALGIIKEGAENKVAYQNDASIWAALSSHLKKKKKKKKGESRKRQKVIEVWSSCHVRRGYIYETQVGQEPSRKEYDRPIQSEMEK